MIKLTEIKKNYAFGGQDLPVLKGINLEIDAGELVAIVGESGSGKSTLMNILGLLDHPSSGEYSLAGINALGLSSDEMAMRRNEWIGFIFQSFYLLPRMTALENVCLPLFYRGLNLQKRIKSAKEMLAHVGLADWITHKPSELSGGQQQRVAIARALAGEPKIILADEPTGALDSKTSQSILDLLISINQNQKATIVIITHDEKVAAQCDRVVLIKDGVI